MKTVANVVSNNRVTVVIIDNLNKIPSSQEVLREAQQLLTEELAE